MANAREAGELAAVYALGVAGIPTWVTRGVNAFAEEAEHALRSGADYEEALTSALIHAGTEVAAEVFSKYFGKIKINGKTVDQLTGNLAAKMLAQNISVDISVDCLHEMLKNGVDILKEGAESGFIWVTGKFAEHLTYQGDKALAELLWSPNAKRELIKEFVQGYLFSFFENG